MARPFALWAVLLVTPALTCVAAGPKAPELALDAYALPNGLKVALHRDTQVPRVTVCVAYHVGSRNEKAGRTGFAHFFEHMMFRGTKNVPNFDIPLQEAGAESNAFTTEDVTVYFETVASNYLARALYLEAERLAFLPSALNGEKFDTEREVVKNERRQSDETRPYGLDGETILARLFPAGHPYSWPVIGSMADLDRATLDDLRRFFAEFYHPGNATLCLAGDFDPAEARALIARYFGPLLPGPKPRTPAVTEVRVSGLTRIERYDEVEFPRVYWNWPTVADSHADAPALDLLAAVLAGGEASRLHKALVLDKALSTDVSADSDTKEAAGLFTIDSTAAVAEDPARSLAAIEEVVGAELGRLRAEPPTEAELARALALFEKSTYSALTTSLGRATTIALGFSQNDDPAHYRKTFERYVRVTPADLARVAEAYLKPEKVVLWTRPVEPGHPKEGGASAGPAPSAAPEDAAEPRVPRGGPDWTALPGPAAPLPFQAPRFVKISLDNGLSVWVAPWSALPLVSVQLLLPGGTADDPKGKAGLATLTATLLNQGTQGRTATGLAETLEALGVTFGASASADNTRVGFSTVTRNLEPALDLLAEVLTAPRFDPADFDRERRLQLADLAQGPDSVGWLAARAFPVLLYGADHPYGSPAEGFTETVSALTLDDVRGFRADHLGPNGATLVVVGDVDTDALLKAVRQRFGAWGPQRLRPQQRPKPVGQAEAGVVYLVDKPGAVQSVVNVGRRWEDRSDARYYATLLGNRILGGDFLSRLNQNLREAHGFTYGAGSSFRFRRAGSVWAVSTQVRADATAPALKEALAELDGLAGGKPFTAEEIAKAVGAEARSFPESFESPGSIAAVLGEMAEFHLPPDYLETFLGRLQGVGPEAIHASMAEVVRPTERVTLIVGDRAAVEPKLKALGFAQVRVVTADGRPVGK